MKRKHFYLTHFSNASQKIYPDNTQTAFTSHLAQPIDLGKSSDGEVGLCQVTYKPLTRRITNGVVIEFFSSVNSLIYYDLIATQFIGQDKVRVLRPIILWPVFGKHLFQNTRVGTLIVATIYLQLIQNRYMFRSLLSFNVITSIVYNPLPAMWKS